MISMKWRADSENSEYSALDTIIVSHKIYGKKLFFHRFDFTSSDSPLKQPTGKTPRYPLKSMVGLKIPPKI